MIFRSDPVGLPGLAALALGLLAFVLAVLVARSRREPPGEQGARRDPLSSVGVAIQALGIGIAAVGPQRVTLDPLGTTALVEAAAIATLMTGAVTLFVAATRAMGRNWSIRARTLSDHRLVQEGPFAVVRNPIYVAIFLLMLALALASGHLRQLAPAVPLFALGTWLRVRSEEALLRRRFGAAYAAYAARVRRFVPGLI